MRASAIQPPAQSPKRPMASSAYSEQLGKCRQRGPISGDKREAINRDKPASREPRQPRDEVLIVAIGTPFKFQWELDRLQPESSGRSSKSMELLGFLAMVRIATFLH